MIKFVKIAFSSANLLPNGLLVKNIENGNFYLVNTASETNAGCPYIINLCGVSFRSAAGNRLVSHCILSGHQGDSFATAMLRFNSNQNDVRNTVGMAGALFDIVDDTEREALTDDTIEFDTLFAAQESVSADGADSEIVIKSGYTRNNTYQGFHGYHHNPGRGHFNTPVNDTKPYRMGIELELYAVDQAAYNKITGARTNWFQCESDGSLGQARYPIEMKTIPLRAQDATSTDFWAAPMEKLKTLAKSKGYTSTGLHVHISKEILGRNEDERQANLGKLVIFYQYFIENDPEAHRKNVVICGRERGYTDSDYKTSLGDFAQKCGMKTILGTPGAKELMDGVTARARQQRSDINLGNWGTYGTIEFRKGKGIISKTRLAAICTWWEQMCLYCKETSASELSFNDFFTKVCNEHPCVAYFFPQEDTEC